MEYFKTIPLDIVNEIEDNSVAVGFVDYYLGNEIPGPEHDPDKWFEGYIHAQRYEQNLSKIGLIESFPELQEFS